MVKDMAVQLARPSAEAGAKKFAGWDSRRFNYYQPKGRKATLYEDVTVDVQPDPNRYLLQGWIISFADGTPAYSETRTALRSADWHQYRSVDEEWERPHYQRQSSIEKMLQLAINGARSQNAIAHFDKGWVTILEHHVSASKHAEYGLGLALMTAQRDGMTQMINNTILTNASYKLRYAQDLTLYLADIGLDLEKFDQTQGKEHWVNDPLWQGTRKLVETVMASGDHLEQYFAINIIIEPLVLELFRSGFVMQTAALHGDFVTPTVVSAAESDFERNRANAIELFSLLGQDARFSEHNLTTMGNWAKHYSSLAIQAAHELQPIWSQTRVKSETFAPALKRAQQNFSHIMAQLQLDIPKEVLQ